MSPALAATERLGPGGHSPSLFHSHVPVPPGAARWQSDFAGGMVENALSDETGKCEFRVLRPGTFKLRAHIGGRVIDLPEPWKIDVGAVVAERTVRVAPFQKGPGKRLRTGRNARVVPGVKWRWWMGNSGLVARARALRATMADPSPVRSSRGRLRGLRLERQKRNPRTQSGSRDGTTWLGTTGVRGAASAPTTVCGPYASSHGFDRHGRLWIGCNGGAGFTIQPGRPTNSSVALAREFWTDRVQAFYRTPGT